MNVKSADVVLRRPICTWLSAADYAKFAAIAEANDVTVAAYLRGIVVDAIAEETSKGVEVNRKLMVVR